MPKFLKFSILISILALLPMFSLSGVHTPTAFAATGVRWASSSNTIYVTGPGTITLTELDALISQNAPLDLVDATNHIWYLGANLKLEQGAVLILHGTSIGGDVAQLRLKSNNSSDTFSTIWIRAEWGTIDIASTKITSWDTVANQPDTEYATYNRSFIYARSFLDADGITARESRMDIVNSEICYLGYYGSEAYGLSWKVIGSSPDLYSKVHVLGKVTGSRIHHNYFGAYTYGAYGMEWRNNEIDNNVLYGFDGHDDSDYFIVEGNNAHHNGNHGIIFSQRCDHSIIRNNVSRNNTGNGIMLHRNSNDSTIENNSTYGNSDSGIAIFDSHNNTIRNNTTTTNSKGIRFSVGSSNNLIENNEISSNTSYGIYFYKGTDVPTSGDGRPKLNRFVGNRVKVNGSYSVRMSEADDNHFERNEFSGKNIQIEIAQRNRFSNNILPDTISYKTTGSSTVATSTYLGGQALFNVSVDSYSSIILEDGSGKIFDPEETKIATTVTSSGSTLTLNKANIGTSSKVATRNMLVTVTGGSTDVNPTIWETTGNLKKEWTSKASSAQCSNSYTVGDLAPGALYTVKKNGANFLSSVPADSNGRINFTDTPGITSTITYTIALGTTGGP